MQVRSKTVNCGILLICMIIEKLSLVKIQRQGERYCPPNERRMKDYVASQSRLVKCLKHLITTRYPAHQFTMGMWCNRSHDSFRNCWRNPCRCKSYHAYQIYNGLVVLMVTQLLCTQWLAVRSRSGPPFYENK